jgi:outer membrane protein assembly factor BamD
MTSRNIKCEIGTLVVSLLLFFGCEKPPMLSTARNAAQAYDECHTHTQKKRYETAQQCLELLRSRYPGTVESIEAEIEIADNYFRQDDFLVSAEAYKNFARLHPTYERIDYVYYRTGQSYLKESPKAVDRDQQYLDDATHYFTLVMNNPTSEHRQIAREKWVEVQRRTAARSFYIARFYYKTGEIRSAIPRFEEVVIKYPYLGYDEKALFYLGLSYLKIGEEKKAEELIGVFDQHYPKSRYKKRLEKKIDS